MPPRAAAKRARLDDSGGWYDPTPAVGQGEGRARRRLPHRPSLARRAVRRCRGDRPPAPCGCFTSAASSRCRSSGRRDGSFDESDYLLFVGRFRRDKPREEGGKDFESIYGRENYYWLTWGGEAGRRFQPKSAEPDAGYPIAQYHWTTAHFEEDQWFQVFADAPDIIRDPLVLEAASHPRSRCRHSRFGGVHRRAAHPCFWRGGVRRPAAGGPARTDPRPPHGDQTEQPPGRRLSLAGADRVRDRGGDPLDLPEEGDQQAARPGVRQRHRRPGPDPVQLLRHRLPQPLRGLARIPALQPRTLDRHAVCRVRLLPSRNPPPRHRA